MLSKQVHVPARVILLVFSVDVTSFKAVIVTNSLHSDAVFQTKRVFSFTLSKGAIFTVSMLLYPERYRADAAVHIITYHYFILITMLCVISQGSHISLLCPFFLPGLFFSIEIWAVPCIIFIYIQFTVLQCCAACTFCRHQVL